MTGDRPLPLLIIEDEAAVLSFLKAALERSGYDVVTAACGDEGLRLLQTQSFRGVVSDMRTPGRVNGADVHRWLQQNRPGMAEKILFITGDTVNEETLKILEKTGVPCIEKPFRVQQLLTMVKKVIGEAK